MCSGNRTPKECMDVPHPMDVTAGTEHLLQSPGHRASLTQVDHQHGDFQDMSATVRGQPCTLLISLKDNPHGCSPHSSVLGPQGA